MITKEITQEYYNRIIKSRDGRVDTLDGVKIIGGFASVFYDFGNKTGFGVYYKKGQKYFETFAQLRKPNGRLVRSFSDGFDEDMVYAAVRPGRYPDNADTFQRFIAAKKTLKVKGNKKKFPTYIKDRLYNNDQIVCVHQYPGNLFLLDDNEDHSDRYVCINMDHLEEEYSTGELDEAEDELFNLFMLYRRSF